MSEIWKRKANLVNSASSLLAVDYASILWSSHLYTSRPTST